MRTSSPVIGTELLIDHSNQSSQNNHLLTRTTDEVKSMTLSGSVNSKEDISADIYKLHIVRTEQQHSSVMYSYGTQVKEPIQ
jgi:hypothetical protein